MPDRAPNYKCKHLLPAGKCAICNASKKKYTSKGMLTIVKAAEYEMQLRKDAQLWWMRLTEFEKQTYIQSSGSLRYGEKSASEIRMSLSKITKMYINRRHDV